MKPEYTVCLQDGDLMEVLLDLNSKGIFKNPPVVILKDHLCATLRLQVCFFHPQHRLWFVLRLPFAATN